MWAEHEADPPACPAAGTPGHAAPSLPDGFPYGDALCPECQGFVAVRDGVLVPHLSYRGSTDARERAARAAWFNQHGFV